MPPATYTVGDGMTYATIQAAVNAIPGAMGGQGIQTVEIYVQNPDVPYPEDVDAQTGFAGTTAVDYIHCIGMVNKAGQIRAGIIIDKNDATTTTCFLAAAYTRVSNMSCTNSGAPSANHKFGILGSVEGLIIDRVFVYRLVCTLSPFQATGIRVGYGSIIRNCAVTNLIGGNNSFGITFPGVGVNIGVAAAYFCDVNNVSAQGVAVGRGIAFGVNNDIARNCIVAGSKTTDYWSGAVPDVDYCISQDATSQTWGVLNNQINRAPIADVRLTNVGVGTEDFHLSSVASVAAPPAGIAIPGITTDFEGDTRGAQPFVGVDEISAVEDFQMTNASIGYQRFPTNTEIP